MAIGIAVFALAAITGLFTVAMRVESDSRESTAAANLAQRLIAERQVTPVDSAGNPAALKPLLPPLDADGTNLDWDTGALLQPFYVGSSGEKVSSAGTAEYGIIYRITKSARSTALHLVLYWPPQADLKNVQGRYEARGVIALPETSRP